MSETRPSQDAVLAELADLHRRFEDQQIDFADFEQAKIRLLGFLDVD